MLNSPWTGSRDADRSGSVSRRTPVPAISRGASCVPRRAPGCCHGCRSGRRRANLLCKVPAVGASLCSYWIRRKYSMIIPLMQHLIASLSQIVTVFEYICVSMCSFRTTAASYLRSLSRAEMVVRRRPLSLLDSAAAIWYSSFSMEKGLAIRRHFRSCRPNHNRLHLMILVKSLTDYF